MGYLTISIFKIHFQFLSYYYILTPTYPPTSFQIYLFTLLLSFCDALHYFLYTVSQQQLLLPSSSSSSRLRLISSSSSSSSSSFFYKKNLTIPLVLLIFFASFQDLLHHFLFLLFFSHFRSMPEFQIGKQISSKIRLNRLTV